MFKRFFKWIKDLGTKVIHKVMNKPATIICKGFGVHLYTIDGFLSGVNEATHSDIATGCAALASLGSMFIIPIYGIYSLLNKKYIRGGLCMFITITLLYSLGCMYKLGYLNFPK